VNESDAQMFEGLSAVGGKGTLKGLQSLQGLALQMLKEWNKGSFQALLSSFWRDCFLC